MHERSRKDRHAVSLGRRGGLIGGKRRAELLSPARRRDIATQAARARWGSAPAAPVEGKTARDRIVKAALDEFAAYGYAGGRVERIARRARVTKRMIYHYFGGKTALFRELLDRFYSRLETATGTLADSLEETQRIIAGNSKWMRIAAWDMLQSGAIRDVPPQRRAMWRAAVDSLREQQRLGSIRSDLDAAQLQLSIVALVMFPFLVPQLAILITGRAPNDPQFLAERAHALRQIATLLDSSISCRKKHLARL